MCKENASLYGLMILITWHTNSWKFTCRKDATVFVPFVDAWVVTVVALLIGN